jgi:hypothetical protein
VSQLYSNNNNNNDNNLVYLTNISLALATATISILIRTCFRVAELHDGYGGSLANDEVLYMILEPVMITIAILALTIGHPGPILGTVWQANGFQLRKPKTPPFMGEEKGESGDHSLA